MTDAEKATEVVEVPEKKLVVTDGVGLDVVRGGLAHLPQLNKEMALEERRDTIREALKEAVALPDRLDVMTGEMLYEVNSNEYWRAWTIRDSATDELRPYSSFKEYALIELGIKSRKAYYLIDIYETFVVKLGLPKEVLRDLEWAKAKEVTKLVTPENWASILEKLSSMTLNQVIEMAKEMSGKPSKTAAASADGGEGGAVEGGTTTAADGGKEKFHKLSCSFSDDQYDIVTAALELAKSMSSSDKVSNQLHLICTDFVGSAAGHGLEGALSKLETIIKHVEGAFGVKLEVKEVDSERYKEVVAAAP